MCAKTVLNEANRYMDDAVLPRHSHEKSYSIVQNARNTPFCVPKAPSPASWPKRANFGNRQSCGEPLLESLQFWIRHGTQTHKSDFANTGVKFIIPLLYRVFVPKRA